MIQITRQNGSRGLATTMSTGGGGGGGGGGDRCRYSTCGTTLWC